MVKNSYILFVLVFCFFSCANDGTEEPSDAVYNVDPVFEKYVQEFITEGAKRGHSISFEDSGLSIQFSEFPLDGAAGLCRLGRYDIEIDKANWFRFSERFRSYLLFHELGHCELNRLHRNDKFSDESWKSILRGDPFKGIDNRQPVAYFGFRKDYFLNELFDPNTPDPDWSRKSFDSNQSFQLSNTESLNAVDRLNERYSDWEGDYEFELEFDLIVTDNTRTKLEWGTIGGNYYVNIIPTWGYYVGVNFEGIDNDLFYSSNINLVNGERIGKIKVRQSDGVDQVFINDQFIFHLDAQTKLDYVKITAMENDQLNSEFVVEKYTISSIN